MTVHVYPINDWIEHQIDVEASECTCLCEPRIEYVDPETGEPYLEALVVHNAIDQREKDESDYIDRGT